MVSVISGLVLAIIVVALGQPPAVLSCQLLVPSELLNGCIFDALAITVPSTGFSITRETCNLAVDKSVFQEQPYVYFNNADEDKIYLVMMIDPDAPNHAVGQFVAHWIVANVPGYVLKQGLGYDIGETVMSYIGPGPPAFSGLHRYMFFVYEQLTILEDLPVPATRGLFSPMDWFESIGGENVVRGPVSSIGFQSEY